MVRSWAVSLRTNIKTPTENTVVIMESTATARGEGAENGKRLESLRAFLPIYLTSSQSESFPMWFLRHSVGTAGH